METVDERTFKEKYESFKWKVRTKVSDGWSKTKAWVSDNKELLAVSVPVALVATNKIIKNVNRMQERQYDYKERYLQVWDPATRQHVKLRRELKPNEQLELSQRNQDGERLTDILFDMGVAKRR